MKVTVTKKNASLPLAISTEFIKLDAALKFASVVESGGGRSGNRPRVPYWADAQGGGDSSGNTCFD